VTSVKICGLQSVEVLKSIRTLPIDLIGLVFAESRRRVTAEQAAAIAREAPAGMGTVGVFVNPSLAELERVLDVVPLTHVQLHGQESPAFCAKVARRFSVQVIKALPVRDAVSIVRQMKQYQGAVDGYLFDAAHPEKPGGTGWRFSWELIPDIQRHVGDKPYWIAGGLTPDNVAELVRTYHPYGVDVSSGVETAGKKDVTKIGQFVEKVKRHDAGRNRP